MGLWGPTPHPWAGDPVHDWLTSGLGNPLGPRACSVDTDHRAQTSSLLPQGVDCCLAFCFKITEDISVIKSVSLVEDAMTLTSDPRRVLNSYLPSRIQQSANSAWLPKSVSELTRPQEDPGCEEERGWEHVLTCHLLPAGSKSRMNY